MIKRIGFFLSILLLAATPCFAAITEAALTSGNSTGNSSTTYTTSSFTPSANKLIVVSITNSGDDGSAPTISGNSLTYDQIDTQTYDSAGKRLTLFRSMGASPTTGAITITVNGGGSWAGCSWSVFEFDGINTGGTNGSAAVGTPGKQSVTATTSNTLTITHTSSSNGVVAAFALDDNIAITPENTEIHDVAVGDGADSMENETQWRADNDTSPSASWTGNLNGAGIAAEIIAAGGAAARRRVAIIGS